MSNLVRSALNWLKNASDLTHHGIVFGLSAVSVPIVSTLPPSLATTACFASVGTQLGTQMWVANVAGPTMYLNMERQKGRNCFL